MTQQPFSRPGAIDLSGFQQPAAPPGADGALGGVLSPSAGGSSYSVEVTQESLQALLQESMTAPVVLVFYSPRQVPESVQYATDVAAVAEGQERRAWMSSVLYRPLTVSARALS